MNVVLKKLKITPPHVFLCVQAPVDFAEKVGADSPGCTFSTDASKPFDSVHWFVKNKSEVDTGFAQLIDSVSPGIPVWVYFPKSSSGIQTDLSRDEGWESLVNHPDVRWLSMISFDDTWTTFCFRLKTEKDRAEDAKPKEERAIFQYADSATKTITLPEDLKEILDRNPAERAIFEALNFSNRREYVEWVITAKQERTRQNRLEGSIERLRKGWKTPSGR